MSNQLPNNEIHFNFVIFLRNGNDQAKPDLAGLEDEMTNEMVNEDPRDGLMTAPRSDAIRLSAIDLGETKDPTASNAGREIIE